MQYFGGGLGQSDDEMMSNIYNKTGGQRTSFPPFTMPYSYKSSVFSELFGLTKLYRNLKLKSCLLKK